MSLRLLFIPACTILFTAISCTKKPSTPPVVLPSDVPAYQEYYVTYNKTQNNTNAEAHLRLHNAAGDYIALQNSDAILINGQRPAYGVGNAMADVEFTFTRKDHTFRNKASRSDIGDISFSASTPSEIDKTHVATFSWDGPPLVFDEQVELQFTGVNTGSYYSSSSMYVNGNTIVLDDRILPKLDKGDYTMTLIRTVKLPLTQSDSTAGGIIYVNLRVEKVVTIK